MRKFALLSFAMALVFNGDARGQAVGEHALAPVASSQASDRIPVLLRKYPRGGVELVLAIEHLLTNEPQAVSAVVDAAGKANREQARALELGIAQAVALLKESNPLAARSIQAYLNANKGDPVVAEALAYEAAQGLPGDGTGLGGGGFVSGAGGFVSAN